MYIPSKVRHTPNLHTFGALGHRNSHFRAALVGDELCCSSLMMLSKVMIHLFWLESAKYPMPSLTKTP